MADISKVRMLNGTEYNYKDAKARSDIEGIKADLGALTVTTVGTQLIDKTKAVSGFVTSSGNIDTSGSYSNYLTSDYIPVEANKTYTLYRAGRTGQITQTTRMAYCLFDSDKQALSYINNGSAVSLAITPTVDGYVRVTMTNNNINTQAMFIEGTNLVGYKAYTSETHLSDDVNPINTIGATYIRTQAINAAKAYRYGDTMTLVKNGNAISVTYGRLTREYFIANGGNSVFNFSNAYLDNTLIKTSGDDITPQRILVNANSSATVGANHGWAYAFRIAKGSFTRADEGSVWTDGTTEYTLIYVSDSYAFFVPPVSKSDGVIQITAIAPVSNLTHVSGATHTDEVSLSGISNQQLYPSINKHATGLYVNGDLVTVDETYDAGKIYIKEQYGIIDIYEWVTYARSHVGNIDLDDMQTLCTITYVVEILKNAEIVYSNLRADTPITLVNSGFMQADPLSANDGVLYRYINGVSSGAFASTNLVDMTSYNTTNKILPNNVRSGQVPNRSVEVSIKNNAIQYGFAFGFIPDIGDGADSKRILNPQLWDMRDTKKSYPYCIMDKTLASGEQVNVVGYRVFFEEMTGVTDKYTLTVGDKAYGVVDAHAGVSGSLDCDRYGNSVTQVNSDGMNVADHVSGAGIYYHSNNDYSASVVKVN